MRIRPSSSVECTFIFSHPTFSICPLSFRFRHQILGIVLPSFRIQRPIEIVGTIDLNHPRLNGGRESVERLPSGVDKGDLLHSRKTRRRQQIEPRENDPHSLLIELSFHFAQKSSKLHLKIDQSVKPYDKGLIWEFRARSGLRFLHL